MSASFLKQEGWGRGRLIKKMPVHKLWKSFNSIQKGGGNSTLIHFFLYAHEICLLQEKVGVVSSWDLLQSRPSEFFFQTESYRPAAKSNILDEVMGWQWKGE